MFKINDSGTEADYLDDGADYLDDRGDYILDETFEPEFGSNVPVIRVDIAMDRDNRKERLVGMYVIISYGFKSGKTVFLQDQRISNKGYWSQFISNAFGFKSVEDAKVELGKISLNDPKIAMVGKNMDLVVL